MPKFHTVPDKTKIYVGSARVSIADIVPHGATPNWKPLSILGALAVTPNRETAKPSAVNGEHGEYVVRETEDINLAMQQLDPEIMNEVSGDLNIVEVETGSKVTGYSQNLIKKEKNTFEPFDKQSFGESSLPVEPENITITAGEETLEKGVDYNIIKDPFGMYGISFLKGQTEDCVVTYDYTPAEKIVIHTGGITEVTPKMLMLETEQADGRCIQVIYYKVYLTSGGGFSYKDDNTADIIDFNVTLQARQDPTRPAGHQLKETVFYRK
jgi:hypothetical protein